MLYFTCTYMVVVSINDARSICNCSTCAAYSSVWVLSNYPRFYYSLHCTLVPNCTFRFLKLHSKKHSALCKSRVGLWSARTAHCLRVASVCGQPEQRTKSHFGLWSARTAHCPRVASVCGQPEQRSSKAGIVRQPSL